MSNGPDNYLSTVFIRVSPSTLTEDRGRSSRLNVMVSQCYILIRKRIKFNWSVTLVNRIRAIERLDTTFIHFKEHICLQDTQTVILLRETNRKINRAGSH